MSSTTPVSVKKRERTQNWVPEEKRALFSLIKTHINAIENKKIDTSATALKSLAWRQIYSNFKGKFSTERDITRMREQWRRMKAQARVDIITFAEKVRTVGLEEATKNRPTDLSVDVWRLLQSHRKNECETTSDESQDADPISNLQEILDNLSSMPLENSFDSGKQESFGEFNDDNPSARSSFTSSPVLEKRKGVRLSDDEPINLANQKRMRRSLNHSLDEDDEHTLVPDDFDRTLRGSSLDLTIEERNFKLRILNLELERVELQKQAAVNELRTSEIRKQLVESQAIEYFSQARMSGERGSGAGRGGGGGGVIREAGGSFGKMEAAHEDQYFYNQQKEQLKNLREGLHDEISFHEEQIKRHQEAINRHKERIGKMDTQ